jgi:EmrB/QacA subfamily drug resistance transporter
VKPRTLTPAEARTVFVGLMMTVFLAALNQTIVATALPTMGRYFNDFENLSWIVTSYLLTSTAVAPLYGKLSDIHGRRTVMLTSIGVFAAGSAACAAAPDMLSLILGRALQGIGGGGILPVAQAIMADAIAPRERGRYQAYMAVVWVTSGVGGPILGGVLSEHFHWSLIFWINLPLGAVALVMTDRSLRKLPRNDRPHRLDYLGAVLMVAAALVLMLALAWGGRRYSWGSLEIVAMIAASALLWGLFALRLARAPEPFIPLALLSDPVVGATIVTAFFAIGTVIGLSIMTPLYLGLVLGLTASQSSLALIAFVAGTTIGSVIAGRLIARMEKYMRVPLAGMLVSIAALVVLAADPAGVSLAGVCALLAAAGLGLGPMYPVTTVVIQNVVLPHQFGTATGTLNFFRQLGGAIIVAAFSAIVLGALGGAGDAAALDTLGGVNRSGADFAAVFRWVFVAAAVFLALACFAMMLVEERPLRGRGER